MLTVGFIAFFTVQLSHPYMTTGKTTALTRRTFVGKVMSLLFNMLSRLVITFPFAPTQGMAVLHSGDHCFPSEGGNHCESEKSDVFSETHGQNEAQRGSGTSPTSSPYWSRTDTRTKFSDLQSAFLLQCEGQGEGGAGWFSLSSGWRGARYAQ